MPGKHLFKDGQKCISRALMAAFIISNFFLVKQDEKGDLWEILLMWF